jgi:hypothetical protein
MKNLNPVNARNAAQGRVEVNTRAITGKIPNPVIQFLIHRIQAVVANSGYANVTVRVM